MGKETSIYICEIDPTDRKDYGSGFFYSISECNEKITPDKSEKLKDKIMIFDSMNAARSFAEDLAEVLFPNKTAKWEKDRRTLTVILSKNHEVLFGVD